MDYGLDIKSRNVEQPGDQVSYCTYSEYDVAEDEPDVFSATKTSLSDTEERYESRGEDVSSAITSSHSSPNFHRGLTPGSTGSSGIGSSGEYANATSTISHSGSSGGNRTFKERSTWLRTSLRRPPPPSLFGRTGAHYDPDADEMYTAIDLSLEDDVMDLNQRVRMLQEQVTALAESRNSNEEKYSRVKVENATLSTRLQMLEEQLREMELRYEERIKDEQRRYKELMTKNERDREIHFDLSNARSEASENEKAELKEEVFRLRAQTERLKQEKENLQDQCRECEYAINALREDDKKLQEMARKDREAISQERYTTNRIIDELTNELKSMRSQPCDGKMFQQFLQQHQFNSGLINASMDNEKRNKVGNFNDIEKQLQELKQDNQCLKESNDELQAQLISQGIEEGRNLIGQIGNIPTVSLAAELETMSKDEIMTALKEQQDVNVKLRSYIDGILLNIMETYPQLLEVKANLPS